MTDWKEEERHPSERLSQPWGFFPGAPGVLESPVTFAKGAGVGGLIVIIMKRLSLSLLWYPSAFLGVKNPMHSG